MSLEDDRILKFGSNRDMDVHRLNLGEITQQWFVKERKMPSITSPMHILDLPNLKTNLCKCVFFYKLLALNNWTSLIKDLILCLRP